MSVETLCPVCEADRWFDILHQPQMVVHVGRLFPTEAEAQEARRGEILLSLCTDCGYIGNRAYHAVDDAFAPGYEASLHHSKVYVNFLQDLADELIARYQLRNKTVLEVACGPGFFLRLMLQRGCAAGIGVDPSLESQGPDTDDGKPITWIRDFYDDRYAHLPVDLVACRQALHTVPDPKALLDSVYRATSGRPGVALYFEVVNAENLFRRGLLWHFMYEYRSYFTANSLNNLFAACGFSSLSAHACYIDGQYLSMEAKSNGRPAGKPSSFAPLQITTEEVSGFAASFCQQLSQCRSRLDLLHECGKTVVAWGAAGRGITFLNLADPNHKIRRIVDINPAREGKFIPGTGALVVSPESLIEHPPDVIVLTNATYADEIRSQVAAMGLDCEFLLA